MLTKKIILALTVLVISACGTVAPSKPTAVLNPQEIREQWAKNQEQLSRLSAWAIKGKAAVRSEAESGTVSMFWQQSPRDFQIKLVAPFGRGTLDIQSDEQGVMMQDAKGRVHRSATAQGLVWAKTGWEIPFEDMQGWVVGLAGDPTNATIQVDSQARTLGFTSKGWDVSYPAYRLVDTQAGPIHLPRKVYIKSKNLVVKLSISEWQVIQGVLE